MAMSEEGLVLADAFDVVHAIAADEPAFDEEDVDVDVRSDEFQSEAADVDVPAPDAVVERTAARTATPARSPSRAFLSPRALSRSLQVAAGRRVEKVTLLLVRSPRGSSFE